LLINELMLDGEPTEDGEFVEILNTGPMPVDLTGIRLTSNRGPDRVRRVEFTAGCLPPGAALGLFPRVDDWIRPAASAHPITADVRSFGFANGGDFDFRLEDEQGQVLDRLDGSGDLIRPGVSLNRSPDGAGPDLAPHTALSISGRVASPGRCVEGGLFSEGCPEGERPIDAGAPHERADSALDAGVAPDGRAPDAAVICAGPVEGDLRINEVMIDGVIPRSELDEFVEVVNTAPHDVDLRAVAVAVDGVDGPHVRVIFEGGCLPSLGALVLRPRLEDWEYVPEPQHRPIVGEARLTLGNESAAAISLIGPQGQVLDRFDPAGHPVREGISLNRDPEPGGPDIVSHDLRHSEPNSPGTCVDGSAFVDGGCPERARLCRPAVAGEVIINEVLVDGVEPGEMDEFVELVSTADEPLSLAGKSLSNAQRDGQPVERIHIEHGCLPPGGALTVYGDRGRWIEPPAGAPFVARVERLALLNDAPLWLELRWADDTARIIELPASFAPSGVSAVREEDGMGATDFVVHSMISVAPASPGSRTDGTPFGAVQPGDEP